MNILVVRWSDKKGSHKKEYTDQRLAHKARKWLLDNGADDVDIAMRRQTAPKPAGGVLEQKTHKLPYKD